MDKIKKFFLTNQNEKQTAAKNTAWLFFGEMFGRLLKFGLILYATRVLSVADFGTFSYALAFIAIFYTFSDLGINTFITRELSRPGSNIREWLSASFALKIILLVVSLAASLIIIPYVGSIKLGVGLVLVLAFLNFSDSMREFLFSVNRASEKMECEAAIRILLYGGTVFFGIAFLLIRATPFWLALGYLIGSIVATIAAVWIFFPVLKTMHFKISAATARTILVFAWPFVAVTIFSTAIANIDSVMLGQMKSAVEVGLYAAGQRIIQFLAIIPSFIALSTLPLMTRKEDNPAESTTILEKTLVVTFALAIPITVASAFFGQEIMILSFGPNYAGGGIILSILVISALAYFPNFVLSNMIFTKNAQKKFVTSTLIGVVVNIGINILLIPRMGAIGASISTVVTEFFITIANWIMLKRLLPFDVVSKCGKIFFANIVFGIIIIIGNLLHVYFIATIVVATVAYASALWLLKESAISYFFVPSP